ncbi:WecB/TagA/CpsF family glycosyltransferase [Glycomyces sp. L485]|uniref:WecB/TagA/CpsF family glycosyltransferase n=1 Tax=Glycomyces sp. L485 TaxID=2909235 RepID=UPI001F4BBB20|nr:WecB/TagA/CpsF family glycosyltransferase [Glycomyces sp. L485]MCH7230154.1 WecB/TagA/CpsF family glycosyltransferase [Glycomyces sp. L485]
MADPKLRRVDVLGVGVSTINQAMALAEVTRWVDNGDRRYVCVTGVHGVMESQKDPELKGIHNASGLTTPDGMPMVWAGRKAGAEWMDRVYGPDLMLGVLNRAAERGWSSFLYGGKDGVPELLAKKLAERIPGVKIAGTYSPPFRPLTEAEDDEIVARINDSGAQLVWVGLSTPKQERWMAAHRDKLNAPALFGVGAAFDFHAGLIPQAPPWMQRNGLEWFFRLTKEPKRLWRRYLVNNPAYLRRIRRNPPYLRD